MKKLSLKKVFLKDQKGNHYRIFSVANPTDRKGEHYLKVVFPDTRGIPLITGVHNKGEIVTEISSLPSGVHEFSYHYRSGVSHFKDSNGHIDSKKDLPTLFNHPALHLVRFIVRSLKVFDIQDPSKIGSEDFVLPILFDGRARGFEFVLSRVSGRWFVANAQGDDPVHTYKITLEDPNVFFHIADCIWLREPIAKGEALIEFFRYDNPMSNFDFKNIKKDN